MNKNVILSISITNIVAILIIALLIASGGSYAKSDYLGEIVWEKTYGGDENDQGNCIIETIDGGYAIVGSTESKGNGKQDLWVLKLDENGELIWEKTYGGDENDQGRSILKSKNNLIVAGWTESMDNIFADYWIFKIDQNGELIWEKTYGGDDVDEMYSLALDYDNHILVLGFTWSKGAGGKDAWLVKLNYNGELQWENFYGDRNSEFAESLILSDNGNIIFCGQKIRYCPKCSGGGFSYFWVAKLNDKLEINWQKIFLESPNSRPRKIIETKSNNILIVGETISNPISKNDIGLVKMK